MLVVYVFIKQKLWELVALMHLMKNKKDKLTDSNLLKIDCFIFMWNTYL